MCRRPHVLRMDESCSTEVTWSARKAGAVETVVAPGTVVVVVEMRDRVVTVYGARVVVERK